MKPQHRRPTHTRRRTAVTLIGLSLALVAGLAASSPALAAKGGGGKPSGGSSSATLTLVPLDSTDGVTHWGQRVTFDVATTATDSPFVDLACTQAGSTVLGATTGFFASYPWPWTNVITLSSQMWTAGAADCTARLYYLDGRRSYTLKTLSFHVEA
jgi:hypothetical protein